MRRRWWAGLAVMLLIAAVWTSCGDGETDSARETSPGPIQVATPIVAEEGTAKMVVDAVSGGEITATTEVSGQTPFAIDISITDATMGYQAYQYYLEWDPGVLALDEHQDLKPAALDLCATPAISADVVAAGCLSTAEPATFIGPVATVTFHCVSNGTSVLHLVTSEEDPASYSTTVAPRGVIIATELIDASVTCLGS